MILNKNTPLYFLAIISFLMFISCNNLMKCHEIEKSETLMLIDISDKTLFEEINEDILANFSSYMKQTNFGNLQECQKLKMSIGNLSGKDELIIKSASVGLTEKGLSGQETRKRTNPVGITRLIKNNLIDFKAMSKDVIYNSSTTILQTLVKAIIGMDDEADNTLLLFSDMVINNKIENVNFYISIPKDARASFKKLIDPILLNQLKIKIEDGLKLKLIVVLKNEPDRKVKTKDVRAFWVKCFKELNIEDFQFIDNLSNKISWD